MSELGIIGSGQLGRMLALAAIPLGVRTRFVLQGEHDALAPLSGWHAGLDTEHVDAAFAAGLDAITTEIENVAQPVLDRLGSHCPLWPPARALAAKRDRRSERRLLHELGLAQPAWRATPDPRGATATLRASDCTEVRDALADAVHALGVPCRVKAAIGAYDGRGQWRVASADDLARVDLRAAPFVVEAEVPFDTEFSLIGVFAGDGAPPRCWAPARNRHVGGILVRSIVADDAVTPAQRDAAEQMLTTLGHALDYRGVLTLECYAAGDAVLVNEFAPRVHNSGHWSIEGADCSQFENHVRAVLGLPLGSTATRGPCITWNVLGAWPDRAALLAIPGLHVHDYGKAPRPGRKLGHVTLTDARLHDPRARAVEALLTTA